MNKFYEMAASRESCRNFDNTKPVEKEKLMKIIQTASLAPSACNSQPWHLTVINNKDYLPKVAETTQDLGMNKFVDNCGAFIVINEEEATLSKTVASKRAPHEYVPIDIGILTSHICFAALEQGLSTCILGWFNEERLRKVLDISPEKKICLLIAVGYAKDNNLRQKKRKEISEIASFI